MRLMKVDDGSNRLRDTLRQHINYYQQVGSASPANGVHPSSSSQYVNAQRVPDIVHASKSISSILGTSEILEDNHEDINNLHHGYMEQEYVGGEGLIIDEELNEEDRRLAAALVAVQVANQQKQQSGTQITPLLRSALLGDHSKFTEHQHPGNLGLPPLSGPNRPVYSSSSADLVDAAVGSYDQSSLTSESLHPLPPLKKVLNRSRYEEACLSQLELEATQGGDHATGHAHIPLESLGLHTEMIEIDEHVKTESLEFTLNEPQKEEYDFEQENDLNDVESESSRQQSLPHKKRIPRRLRQPKSKTPTSSSSTPASLPSILRKPPVQKPIEAPTMSSEIFTCQLCSENFKNQWKFFEHLKSHYEVPKEPDTEVRASSSSSRQRGGDEDFVQPAAPRASTSRTTRASTAKPARASRNKWSDDNYENQQVLYQCHICKRVFRRHRAWETHLESHKEESEFSDPEDMMEGIKVDVVSDDETLNTEEQKEWCDAEELYPPEEGELSVSEIHVTDLETMKVEDTPDLSSVRLVKGEETEDIVLEDHAKLRTAQIHDPDSIEGRTCAICGTLFGTRKDATAHINQAHKDVMTAITKCTRRPAKRKSSKTLTCTHCDRTFNHMNSLNYHLKSHSGARDYPCKVCGRCFLAKGALKVHMRQHTGSKPFKCEFCGRCFRQWGDVKYHVISIHSNQKNYQCEYCGKDFARKYSLTVHSRIHTGERNYKCTVCDKSFRAASYLSNHAKIHTGERPHACEVCGKPFRVRSDMRRHMMRHKMGSYPKETRGKSNSRDGPSSSRDEYSTHSQSNSSVMASDLCQVEDLGPPPMERMIMKTVARPATEHETARAASSIENSHSQRDHNNLYFWQVYPT